VAEVDEFDVFQWGAEVELNDGCRGPVVLRKKWMRG
jgi:hypothetical protein